MAAPDQLWHLRGLRDWEGGSRSAADAQDYTSLTASRSLQAPLPGRPASGRLVSETGKGPAAREDLMLRHGSNSPVVACLYRRCGACTFLRIFRSRSSSASASHLCVRLGSDLALRRVDPTRSDASKQTCSEVPGRRRVQKQNKHVFCIPTYRGLQGSCRGASWICYVGCPVRHCFAPILLARLA
jgi:hypothetical protein